MPPMQAGELLRRFERKNGISTPKAGAGASSTGAGAPPRARGVIVTPRRPPLRLRPPPSKCMGRGGRWQPGDAVGEVARGVGQ